MRARKRRLALPWVIVALMLTLLTLGACAEVNVVDITPDASRHSVFVGPPVSDPGRHDLAILAVDFDPPLDYRQRIFQQRSVALLVVIENLGTVTERDVGVWAQLSAPEDEDLLLSQDLRVGSIAPGEIQMVRFEGLGKIPFYDTYHLKVAVQPVDGESDPGNNRKAFDIEINRE
ncbi:MAG: hypothetical protein M8467_06240 [Anaerolineae bacterium]|nr:hypothetical protein [Anaerolineae bacterium]